MLNKIIRFSLRNRITVLIVAVLTVLAGTYVALTMEVDVFPDLNAPTVTVMTEAGGMAPEEVERLVTFPVETAVNGAVGVRRVRSQSTTGFSVVWVEFDWDMDEYRARQIVSEKLSEVSDRLPVGVGRPVLGPQTSILGEVMIIGLTADSTSMEELRTLAEWTLRPRLLATGGVAAVNVLGGDAREYQVLLNSERMRHYDVSLSEVLEAVDGMNRNSAGGVLYEYGNEYIIRGVAHTTHVEDMGRTVVKMVGGSPVLLEHVAQLVVGVQEPRTGLASNRLKPAVLLTVKKQPQTATLLLTEQLDAALEQLKTELPEDVVVDAQIFRQSRFIESSIGNIKTSLYEGALFVTLVLFLFLMNVRTTLISLVTIPLALLVTLLVLHLMGLTINTMSIGGMAIAIGSLVDDAIVDVENVFRHLRANCALPVEQCQPVLQVVYAASKEVRIPILNSTLIIVASFMPLFFLSGMEGRMLVPLGVAFIVSLFASTLVALTLTPVLCSYLLGHGSSAEGAQPVEPRLVRGLKKYYSRLLQATLEHKRMVLALTAVAVLGGVVAFFTLGRSFLPPFNEGSFTVNVSTLPGVSLAESDRVGREAERLLLSVPEVQTVARKTGRAELDEHSLGVNTSEIEAPYVLTDRSRSEVVAEVRQKLSSLPGVNVELGQPISHRIDAMLSGTQSNIAIKLFAPDLNASFRLGNEIKEVCSSIEGVVDLNVEQQVERPQLQIVPRRDMLAKYGVSPAEFAEWVEVWIGGRVVGQVYEGNKAFNLTVKADEGGRGSIEAIRNLTVDSPMGKVPFIVLADVTSTSGPNTINRENVERKVVVSANVQSRDQLSVVNEMKERIAAQVEIPEGHHVEFGGQFESEQAASRILGLMSVLSVLIIFVLLYYQFRSSSQALVVLLNLPLALIGGVAALTFSSGEISIPAIIGFISLFGIATRNGILLIDRYNDLRAEGVSLYDSVLRGSVDRLNPILMTALTSALALIPLVIGDELPGNEIQSPMAKVMLGGLLSSTLLNGFVIPIMYVLIHRSGSSPRRLDEIMSRGVLRKKVVFTLSVLFLLVGNASAQTSGEWTALLDSIEQRNTTLKALQAEHDEQAVVLKSESILPNPEVEFHYLWGYRENGGVRQDISFRQHLDWAFLMGVRKGVVNAEKSVLAMQYRQERVALRLAAQQKMCDLVYAQAHVRLCEEKRAAAQELHAAYDSLLARGATTILEVNKAAVAYAESSAQQQEAETEYELLKTELAALNGGQEPMVLPTSYPEDELLPMNFEEWYGEVERVHPALQYAQAQVEAGKQRNRQTKLETMPSLTVGYMTEGLASEGYHGVTVGVSVPLWNASSRLKQGRAAVVSAQSRAADISLKVRNELQALYKQTVGLKRTADDYRRVLTTANPQALLLKALKAGKISLTEYLWEVSAWYDTQEKALASERTYRKVLSELEAATW